MPSESYHPTFERDTLTLEELASRVGISMSAAYALARRNELPVPVIRIGRRYLFSRFAFETVIMSQRAPRANSEPSSDREVADEA